MQRGWQPDGEGGCGCGRGKDRIDHMALEWWGKYQQTLSMLNTVHTDKCRYDVCAMV